MIFVKLIYIIVTVYIITLAALDIKKLWRSNDKCIVKTPQEEIFDKIFLIALLLILVTETVGYLLVEDIL